MTTEDLGSKIRMLRHAHAVTQAELGKIVGVSNITISNYERGTVVPPTHKLLALATFFKVNVSYLVGDSEYLHEPGAVYTAPKKVPLVTQELALNLPELIVPYASEYIEVPIEYTNNNTFAVEVLSDGVRVKVAAERGNRKTPILLCKSNGALVLRPRSEAVTDKKNIIGGVLYFL